MRQSQYVYFLLAVLAGGFLASMIFFNSQLAIFYSPTESSWFAHGIGGLTAVILMFAFRLKKTNFSNERAQAPWWSYLGGLPGAFTVLLAGITVNSHLGLTGSLALGLVGQIIFSLFCDYFGWFGLKKRPMHLRDVISMLLICSGSLMVIYSKGAI